MDERELEYLREQIRGLQRSNTRWKLLAVGSLVCFGIFFLVSAGMFLFTVPGQVRVERMRMAEMEALMQAEQARAAAIEARAAMEKNKAEIGLQAPKAERGKEAEKQK